MKDQALYEYIQRELEENDAESLDECDYGISIPEGVTDEDFLRVLEEVETDIQNAKLAE